MRRAFKPYLRHPLSKRPAIERPDEPEIIEVTILPEWDAVLRYDGSPLMVEGTVTDTNGKTVVPGGLGNYNNQDSAGIDENGNVIDWIAIGLGTDNQPIDKFRSPNPIDDTVDPDDDIADGVVYTNTGPTRSVLSFNLEDIPPGAIIEEAFLELVPVTDKSNDDVWNEFDGENINVWPETGVECEVLNLIRDTEQTCTWNASSHATVSVNGVEYPDQTKRWHNQPNSETLPNPIGAMQNSKRWDIQEGAELFSGQYNDSETIDGIDSNGTEKYGHVGYGAMGGGAVENVPENKSQLSRFRIAKGAHDEQMDGDTEVDQNIIDGFKFIDVGRAVRYAHENQAGRCNLLLRATHWEGVLDPDDDQTEQTFTPGPLTLDSILLEDQADSDDQVEIDHNAIIRFTPATFDIDGNPDTGGDITWIEKAAEDGWNVLYDWQVKYPDITNFPGPDFEVTLTRGEIVQTVDLSGDPLQLLEGDVLSVRNMSSSGGFDNRHYFEFFVDDGDTSEDGGEQPQGIDQDFEITSGFIPEDDDSLTVGLRIGARAQGANPSSVTEPAFPSRMQEFLQIGTIEKPTVEVTPPSFQFSYSILRNGSLITEEEFSASPLNDTDLYTITYILIITNTRSGFDWENSQGESFVYQYGSSVFPQPVSTPITGGGTVLVDLKTTDETQRRATHTLVMQFTGAQIKQENTAIPETTTDALYRIGLSSYTHIGFDENGDLFNDNNAIFNVVGDQPQQKEYSFSVAQDNTTNSFDITVPEKRRGVFTTTNLRGPLVNRRSIGTENTSLTQPDSFVKTNMFQRELAPCQLDCGDGVVFNTALLPIEERSRFSEITATKNKFALLNLTQGLQVTFDESDIRDGNGNEPATPGNPEAVVSLVTSGGAGEMISRQRNGADIVLPSDLAVYYYNDNDGQTDIGWVYYRAVSKKLTPQTDHNNFRNTDSIDYTVDDFTVTNTDDGLEYIGWEKLSGDQNNLLANIDINADDPNVGAHLFLLDDRYDFVETPSDLELQDTDKWPVPYTEAFPLGRGVGGANNPDNPTGLEARNNPSLFETFPEGEGVNVLSELSSVMSVVEWKIGSLDSGTSDQQIVNPSIVRTVLDAEQQPDSGTNGVWVDSCPDFNRINTRSADNKVQPLPDSDSLFVCFNRTVGDNEPDDSPIQFKSWHTIEGDGLGSDSKGVPAGARMETGDGSLNEYCNAKSHFWNGLYAEIDLGAPTEPFTVNGADEPTTGLGGRVPLFWRMKKDCGPNDSTNKYFKDITDNDERVTSDLDRPLSQNGVAESDGYHGINIAYGQFHDDYILAQRPEDTPVLEYIVEVIRGGSVYHRDIYRLANAQAEWSQERTVADRCFPCRFEQDINEICNDPADTDEAGESSNKSDTLYQVGIDGNAWKEGWYNPSDWRAGDIIRIYAIQPRIEGDQVVVDPGGLFEDADIRTVSSTEVGDDFIPPTPPIQRIKKFCPVGESWDAELTYPPCCNNFVNNCTGENGRISPSTEKCCDGTVCIISCSIPGLGGDGGIDPNDL